MKTGFKNLDKLINLGKPQLILLAGTDFVDMLSGDIANNVCLKQKGEVLEITSSKKEYLIKRLLINECNVDYRKWSHKAEYTKEELQQIGQNTVNLIEVTKRLPTIIEQDVSLFKLKNVTKIVSEFANSYADKEKVNTLVVLDIFPFHSNGYKKGTKREMIKFIKDIKKISIKLRCPIILVNSINYIELSNEGTKKLKYVTKEDICNIDKINKYVDKFVITNYQETGIFDVSIQDRNSIIGNCKLKWDYEHRKFLNK